MKVSLNFHVISAAFISVTIHIEIADLDDSPPDFYNLPSSFQIFEYDDIGLEEFKPYNIDQDISITDEDLDFQTGFIFELTNIKNTPDGLIEIDQKEETRGLALYHPWIKSISDLWGVYIWYGS